jgi:hypothetical protein
MREYVRLAPMISPMPPPPPPASDGPATAPDAPGELRKIVVLLIVNLALSIALTIATVIARHSIVDYQLDHRHITGVVGNIVVSVVYVFLVRALLRGRRWAYRRVIWLGTGGILALLLIQLTPYPVWMRAEQLVQALILAALVYFVLRPEVRAHFAKGLPGRDVRRFGRRP